MSKLIDKLKSDHKAIVDLLSEVQKLGVTNPEGVKKLKNAKDWLLAHLKLEDAQLYPELQKASQTNNDLKVTLNMMAKDMDTISKEALNFFAKYAEGGDPMEFARDYGKLYSALSMRIRREESTIYQEYEKLQTAA